MSIKDSNLFVTGGAGCLGRALARRRKQEGWTGRLTVYSTDTFKHERMRREYPDVQFVQGDIRSSELLYNAMVGHDMVLHMAAVKVIPVSEYHSIDTYDVNVNGSLAVCEMAHRAGIQHVLGISTDKCCYPVNAYGATKMLMEKTFQEYARVGFETQYHLLRYGNVLESTGSVVEAWKRAVENGEPIKITDPAMTRFWLSPSQAIDHVISSLEFDSGLIYIPMMPALSIGRLAEFSVGETTAAEHIPMRPGEKMHECLLTEEETHYAQVYGSRYFILSPTTEQRNNIPELGAVQYTSDTARELTREELVELLRDELP